MNVIGIVGGTGAGKTTALRELATFDVEILDCDAIYHQLLLHSQGLREAIVQRFGNVFGPAGLDRRKLGQLVFGDQKALQDLNAITFHHIVSEVHRRMAQAEQRQRAGVAIDAVALLESPLRADCQTVVAVVAPEELRVRRIMAREGISEAYARQRVAAQKPESYFRAHCDYILENNGTQEAFQQQARALFARLMQTAR